MIHRSDADRPDRTDAPHPPERFVEDVPAVERSRARLRRHLTWLRRDGVGRMVEEDQLNPADRIATAVDRWRWRRREGRPPGAAMPVYVVGVQRSGTNMVTRGLERAPEIEVHNENDRTAFERFRLRPDSVVRDVVQASAHQLVLFKPLCDSHRVDELLDTLGTATPGRALWAFRDVDGRVQSAVAKFGDVNLRVMEEIAAGRAGDRWQAQRISPASLALIRSIDYARATPETGAALFWYARNAIFFEQGLDRRDDVMALSYDAAVADPERSLRAVSHFLGLAPRPEFWSGIESRHDVGAGAAPIDPAVRERCRELAGRLEAHAARQLALHG